MKNILSIAALTLAFTAPAHAAQFNNCAAELTESTFYTCPEGPGGGETVCRVEDRPLGTLTANLEVTSSEQAKGSVVFTDTSGKQSQAKLACALTTANGDVNDMECTATASLGAELGRAVLSFNSAEAPYYVAVFTEKSNAPVGAFHTSDCR